jgi:hypothetical protein
MSGNPLDSNPLDPVKAVSILASRAFDRRAIALESNATTRR